MTDVRTARYERQVDALEAMKRLAGLHISQAEYSQWESGSRVPRDDNPKVARLYEFFGSRPTEPQERTETPDALVAALLAQTAAITAQTDAINRLVQHYSGLAADAVREGAAEAHRVVAGLQGGEGSPPESLREQQG